MPVESVKMVVESWLKKENEANFKVFRMDRSEFLYHVLFFFYKHKRYKRCFQRERGSNGLKGNFNGPVFHCKRVNQVKTNEISFENFWMLPYSQ